MTTTAMLITNYCRRRRSLIIIIESDSICDKLHLLQQSQRSGNLRFNDEKANGLVKKTSLHE